jgi:hypothetical protein
MRGWLRVVYLILGIAGDVKEALIEVSTVISTEGRNLMDIMLVDCLDVRFLAPLELTTCPELF